MRRTIPLLVVVLAWGCGSAGTATAPNSTGPSTIATVGTDAGTVHITRHRDSRGTYYRIPAPPEQVWPALVTVQNELGIETGTVDRSSWTVGNRQFTPPSRLAGEPLAGFIQCGVDGFGVPLANNAHIQMSVVTMLASVGDGATRLETQLEATARRRGTGSSPVQCGTSGRLEARIAALTQLRAVGP